MIKKYDDFIKEGIKSSITEPTDEEVQKAEDYLKEGIDPSWNIQEFGYFYIDVSGKYSVYYTLWRFKPSKSAYVNPFNFITNLSTDFMTAVQKAKKVAGRVPVIIDRYGTQAGMFRASKSELLSFGKYRGKTLGEVFVEDPQYILWLSKNYDGKSQERKEKINYYKDLYFETLTKKNLEESKSQFIGNIGDKIEIDAEIINVEQIKDQFKPNKINYKCKMVDDKDNKYLTYNIGREVKKGNHVKLKGKISNHKEVVGIKWTVLNYCKVISIIEEDMGKFNL